MSFELASGEILGLVGESGSGKTTTALALLGYAAPGLEITDGALDVAGSQLRMDESMRSVRGSLISYVPQNPGTALNPALRVTSALEDLLRAHRRDYGRQHEVALALLDKVGLEVTPEFGRRFPHQLSGGQQQRVCIAGALSCDPAVIVLDEPTTGLDVVTQSRILTELLRLRDEQGVSMIYVTHDMAVVAQVADRIAVMYAGRIVEQGRAREVLQRPLHPYTRGLLTSIPDHVFPRALEPMPGIAVSAAERPSGCPFAPRCPQATPECTTAVPPLISVGGVQEARCIHWEQTPPLTARALGVREPSASRGTKPILQVEALAAEHKSRNQTVVAARDVSFEVRRGECVALVGESGSGKTTIARSIAGLHPIAAGRILLDGNQLPSLSRKRSTEQRRRIQLVFQNPADALNPRHTIRETIARPAQLLRGLSRTAAQQEVNDLLEHVRLPERLAARYPAELSGGERQRVGIARALAAKPDVLLCDEITSALDVSVQAAVLKILGDLRVELGLALLLITHDLGVVATVADEVLVLNGGNVCERGRAGDVLNGPEAPYTQRLLEAAPSVSTALESWKALEPGPDSDFAAAAGPGRGTTG